MSADSNERPEITAWFEESGPSIESFFYDGDNNPADGLRAIFPIIRVFDGFIEPVATGFFITSFGLFVTAAHALVNKDGSWTDNLYGIEIIRGKKPRLVFRPIIRKVKHAIADVAVGILARSGADNINMINRITLSVPRVGENIATWAFPRPGRIDISSDRNILKFDFKSLVGKIHNHYPNGRDNVLLPCHCFEAIMHIDLKAGCSGGPVTYEGSFVFGINSTGIDNTDISYISSIKDILELSVPGLRIEGENEGRSVTINEMIERRWVIVDDNW